MRRAPASLFIAAASNLPLPARRETGASGVASAACPGIVLALCLAPPSGAFVPTGRRGADVLRRKPMPGSNALEEAHQISYHRVAIRDVKVWRGRVRDVRADPGRPRMPANDENKSARRKDGERRNEQHQRAEAVRDHRQIDRISEDYLLGRLNRRELLAAGAKLGVGASLLATSVATIGLTRGALAAENGKDPASEILARLNLPYSSTHDAPAPSSRHMVPAGKFKKPGPWKIGFSNNFSNNSWRTNMLWCLKYYATQHKDKLAAFYYTDSNQNISQQISDIQSMQERGVDALLLEPSVGSSLNAVVTRMQAQGTPVIPFDGVLKGVPYATWVGMNLRYIGVASASYLINKLGNKGNILICRGMAGNFIDTLWWEDAEKLLKASGLKIVGQVYTNWDFAMAKENVTKFLASNPGDIQGVWNENGGAAMGLMEAFEEAGRKVPTTMGDQNNGFLKKWQGLAKKTGYEAHGYVYPTWLSADALEIAFRILGGESVYHDDYRPQLVITNDNLDKYVRPNLPDSYFSADYLPEAWTKKMYSEKITFNDLHG